MLRMRAGAVEVANGGTRRSSVGRREGGMKGSRGVWAWLALVLLLGAAVMGAGGCQRNPLDETPPFKGRGEVRIVPRELYEDYTTDEAKADKEYKGKVLHLITERGWGEMEGLWRGRTVRVDSAGDKYVAGTVANPKAAVGKREAIRCYLYHPENPLVVTPPGGAWGEYYWEDIIGVCVGKVDGVIVLRKCYYQACATGGPVW
jgi:hypothetical protein